MLLSCQCYWWSIYIWRVWSENAIKAKVKNWVTPAKTSTIDRKIPSRFHLFAKCDISNGHIAFWKRMEAGLYFPVYRRCFHGGNSMFSLWPLSRFVTKLFIYKVTLKKKGSWLLFYLKFSFGSFVLFSSPNYAITPKSSLITLCG